MKLTKFFCLILALVMMLTVVGCGTGENSTDTEGNSSNQEDSVRTSNEDFFEWEDNIIVGLSDEGAKQESLVIPAKCEGFNGMIFADKENKVSSVSFESDEDIALNCVFGGASQLKSIELPAGLTEISAQEFWLCESLESIVIPENVTSIGTCAFQDNTSLKDVVFEGSIAIIDAYAFDGCTALDSIYLPDSVTTIGKYAFYECTALETVTLPTALVEIGEFAFANSGLVTIIVPETVVLSSYATTSFTQADHEITIQIVEGSWMDENFDAVFNGAFIKNYSE